MKKIIIANWKLNSNIDFIKNYIKKINKINFNNNKYEISIAPPIIYLYLINKLIKNKFNTTSQNIDIHLSGAFTGETSGWMLKDINTKYVIIGHSERRKYHKENNKLILKKIIISKKSNLIPIICIGENEKEYLNNESIKTCKLQINCLIKNNEQILDNTIIAYEPIWAIGTNKTADLKHIIKIHKFIKKHLKKNNSKIKIIYGGSININNAKNIIQNEEIQGLLIGSSSLDINNFINIINSINEI